MEIKHARIVSASAKKSMSDTMLVESYDSIETLNCEISVFVENTEALSTLYNMAITQALKDDVDCLILAHDDVILEEDPIPKLEKLFDTYDLVGLAGPSKIELKEPALWHIMGGGFKGGNLHGCVQHLYRNDEGGIEKLPSNFGPYPHRVVMIDGVFMALSRKIMEKMRFDENNPCKFHFYDLDFSINSHLNGYKVGVGDILITHASPGLREYTQDWVNGNNWFLSKHSN